MISTAVRLSRLPVGSSARRIEGWFTNADGTRGFLVGYYNRNSKQELDVPIGPDNRIEPGGPDLGQPTHFLPRRNRFVFKVHVPKGWGDKEMIWTLTTHGKTEKAYATLRTDSKVDDVVKASETGALGAGTILDVGSGAADVPLALANDAARRGAGIKVTCLDRSEQMLAIARRRTQNHPALTFVRAEGEALPFGDAAFDVVTCTLALHHFEPPAARALLHELRRVARVSPVVCDLRRSATDEGQAQQARRVAQRGHVDDRRCDFCREHPHRVHRLHVTAEFRRSVHRR